MSLKIHIIPAIKDNYIFALSNNENQCAIVDPGEAAPVLDFLQTQKMALTQILCTHHHWDHVDGIAELVRRFPVPVWTSEHDLKRIPNASQGLQDGNAGELFGEKFQVIALPGHTQGQIAFWFQNMNALFSGDTLFSCGCGRLKEGTAEQLFASLGRLKFLPAETLVYFAHEYTLKNIAFAEDRGENSPSLAQYKKQCEEKIARGLPTSPALLSNELQINPFLKAQTVEEFAEWRSARDAY